MELLRLPQPSSVFDRGSVDLENQKDGDLAGSAEPTGSNQRGVRFVQVESKEVTQGAPSRPSSCIVAHLRGSQSDDQDIKETREERMSRGSAGSAEIEDVPESAVGLALLELRRDMRGNFEELRALILQLLDRRSSELMAQLTPRQGDGPVPVQEPRTPGAATAKSFKRSGTWAARAVNGTMSAVANEFPMEPSRTAHVDSLEGLQERMSNNIFARAGLTKSIKHKESERVSELNAAEPDRVSNVSIQNGGQGREASRERSPHSVLPGQPADEEQGEHQPPKSSGSARRSKGHSLLQHLVGGRDAPVSEEQGIVITPPPKPELPPRSAEGLADPAQGHAPRGRNGVSFMLSQEEEVNPPEDEQLERLSPPKPITGRPSREAMTPNDRASRLAATPRPAPGVQGAANCMQDLMLAHDSMLVDFARLECDDFWGDVFGPDVNDEQLGRVSQMMVWIGLWADWVIVRITGLVPWYRERAALSRAYQVFVLILCVLCLIASETAVVGYISLQGQLQHVGPQNTGRPKLLADLVLSLGCPLALVFLNTIWDKSRILDSEERMLAFAENGGFLSKFHHKCGQDFMVLFLLWGASVLASIYMSAEELAQGSWTALSRQASFLFLSSNLLCQSYYILRNCHFLLLGVENFSVKFAKHLPEIGLAENHWTLLEAFIRRTCGDMQYGFFVLVSMALAGFFAAILDAVMASTNRFRVVDEIIVLTGVTWIILRAAQVTDQCGRVSSLVGTLNTGRVQDVERMYLVQYIAFSKAGFEPCGLRLDSETALNLIYLTGILAFGISTNVLTHLT